jgi:hypothetical protein
MTAEVGVDFELSEQQRMVIARALAALDSTAPA